jgi:protein-histidine pros-kinase
LSGYSNKELTGLSIEKLVPESRKKAHKSKRELYQIEPKNRSMGAGLNLFMLRKNNKKMAVDIDLLPIKFNGKSQTMCSILDVSKRREFEQKLNNQFKNTQLTLDIINYSRAC